MNKLYNFQQYDLLKGLILPKRKAYKKARYKKAQIRFSRRNVRNWKHHAYGCAGAVWVLPAGRPCA